MDNTAPVILKRFQLKDCSLFLNSFSARFDTARLWEVIQYIFISLKYEYSMRGTEYTRNSCLFLLSHLLVSAPCIFFWFFSVLLLFVVFLFLVSSSCLPLFFFLSLPSFLISIGSGNRMVGKDGRGRGSSGGSGSNGGGSSSYRKNNK